MTPTPILTEMKPSKSPDRHKFQRDQYIEHQLEACQPLSEDYLDMFDMISERERTKWNDPKSKINNMEWDLVTTDWILEKARSSDSYAQNIYAAMCNNEFQKLDVMPILKDEKWSCSWRYAGGIVADMQEKGDYIDWYCSGIIDENFIDKDKYVPEGCITDEIRNDLQRLGWAVVPGGNWEKFS